MSERESNVAGKVVLGLGIVICLWAVAALIVSLNQAGSLDELVRQYMVATGMITLLHRVVDCFTHIKGIEYLLCVTLFVVFPTFYVYLNKEMKKKKIKS